MVAIFHDMMHQIMEVYIDDVVVRSRARKDHLNHLRNVFNRCILCAFGVTSGKFQGFVVTDKGIQIDPDKVEVVTTMRSPANVKELQTFIGRVSYVRRFILGLAQLFCAFTPLLKKNKQLQWGDDQEQAFQKLKEFLISAWVLRPPVKGEPLYYNSLLAQNLGNDQLCPIHFISRGFRDAEFRYSKAEQACLVFIYATQKLRSYLLAHETIVVETANPIAYLATKPVLSGRTAYWLQQLSDFELKYQRSKGVRGQTFKDLLDAFPSMDMTEISDEIPGEVAEVQEEERCKRDAFGTIRTEAQELIARRGSTVIEHNRISTNKHADALATLATKLQLNEADEGSIVVKRRALHSTWKEDATFELKDDWRTTYIEDLTREADDQLLPVKVLKQFVVIRGASYFRTSGGALSRCVGKPEAQEILNCVHEKSCGNTRGIPLYRRLQRMGVYWPNMAFQAATVMYLLNQYGIKFHTSIVYYPQGKSKAEATKTTLLRILSRTVHDHHRSWHEKLPLALWAYHISKRSSTGASPYSLVYREDAILPAEIAIPSARMAMASLTTPNEVSRFTHLDTLEERRDKAERFSDKYRQRTTTYYNQKVKERVFSVNDVVMKIAPHVQRNENAGKIVANWQGPFMISEAAESRYYYLRRMNGSRIDTPINSKWLKTYYA
ncbi:uncharacterized protein LOC113351941 [Papaver somniferum]|uniref:uncharacterized protein LOC113351941 n=1 Tax=Papaver somniferum TaxID=3469 RepID=UPI000E6F9876|nr:uncharacterized protein LOC113351941 [Papaver somniferum]